MWTAEAIALGASPSRVSIAWAASPITLLQVCQLVGTWLPEGRCHLRRLRSIRGGLLAQGTAAAHSRDPCGGSWAVAEAPADDEAGVGVGDEELPQALDARAAMTATTAV